MAVELVSKRANLLDALVTHRFMLDQVAEAFATAEDKSQRSLKVQLQVAV